MATRDASYAALGEALLPPQVHVPGAKVGSPSLELEGLTGAGF